MILGLSGTMQQQAEIEAAGARLAVVDRVRSWETDELVDVLAIVFPGSEETFESTRDAWLYLKDPALYADVAAYRKSGAAQLPALEQEIEKYRAKVDNARAHIARGDGVAHYRRVAERWQVYLERAERQIETARSFAGRRAEIQARLDALVATGLKAGR